MEIVLFRTRREARVAINGLFNNPSFMVQPYKVPLVFTSGYAGRVKGWAISFNGQLLREAGYFA